ncbi:hypothetical protein DL96DRAFT_1814020 [Flagelloscypha sp. PMI_526]|nr:hypothetical protein DL96DRAFT_1814020 [Flagelloscypha sp. PMI_526]
MHRALEISEIREQIVGFVGLSSLLQLAKTNKLFTEFALQRLYENTLIENRLKDLLPITLPLDTESRVLTAADCETFLRVARHTQEICYDSSEPEFTHLPRIVSRDSPILFPNLRSLQLDFVVEQFWYPAILAYLPPTLQRLTLEIMTGDKNTSDAQIACNVQHRALLKFLAERPENDRPSLSELGFKRLQDSFDESTTSYLNRFMRTQHNLESLGLDHVPLNLWPYLAELRHLQTLVLYGYCLPFDEIEVIIFNNVSNLSVNHREPWQNPRGLVPGVAFTNIRRLSLIGPVGYLTSWANTVRGSHLGIVSIEIWDTYELSLINDLLCTLRSEASISSLKCFACQITIVDMDPLPFEAFHSVLVFTHITDLSIDLLGGMDLEESDLSLISNSFPNLQSIFVAPPAFPGYRPRLTLASLGHFTKCSQMQRIRLGFQLILPPGTQIPSTTSPEVEIIIDAGYAPFSEGEVVQDEFVVGDVVAFLEAVFTKLRWLECPFSSIICDAHPKLEGLCKSNC